MGGRTSRHALAVSLALLAGGCGEVAYIGLREVDRENDGRGIEVSFRGKGSILLQAENGRIAPRTPPPAATDDLDAGDAGTAADAGDTGAGLDPDGGAPVDEDASAVSDEFNLCFAVDANEYTQLFFSVYPTSDRDVILTARFFVEDDDGQPADCSAVFAEKSARLRLMFGDGGTPVAADTSSRADMGSSDASNDAGADDDTSADAGVGDDASTTTTDGGAGT